MGKMPPHILLVDDNVDFAKEYAETLQNQCQSTVLYATTAEQAVNIVKKHPIKVVILDQLMPTKGTELFKKIKQIDSRVKTVLLTAEADKRELTDAANMGFDYTLLKEERDMDKLPTMLLLLIMKYNALAFSDKQSPFFVWESGGFLGKKQKVEYSIVAYEIEDKDYVFPDSWQTRNFVERGTVLTLEDELNVEEEFSYSNDFHIENEQSLGIDLEQTVIFKTNLASKMQQDFKNNYTESLKRIMNRKVQFEIKDDSTGVISRSYEYAKVFYMIKVFVQKTCSCCQSKSIDAVTVFLPIPVIKYRIREYYNDGSNKDLDSGEIRGKREDDIFPH